MADTTNDGGPAFPDPMRGAEQSISNQSPEDLPSGMSLRDYYAGQALSQPHDMNAVMAIAKKTGCVPSTALACICFDWAEAMMAERERRYGHKPGADGSSVE